MGLFKNSKLNFFQYKSILVLVVVLLSGCKTANVRDDYTFSEETEAGIIIGSVTQTKDTGTATNTQFFVNYHSKKNKKTLYSKEESALLGYLGAKSEFGPEEDFGRIFVIEIPPGKHEVDHWNITHGDGGYYGFTLYPKSPSPVLNFDVTSGDIIYLGNFHMNVESGKNLFGMTIPTGGVPEINDEYDRDIKLFKKKFAQFSNKEIKNGTVHSGLWINEANEIEELSIPKSE